MQQDPEVVFPDGCRWTPTQRHSSPDRWQLALTEAKGQKEPILCLCRPNFRLPLYVTSRGNALYLARYPRTGHQHQPDCRFYEAPPAENGRGAYDEETLKVTDDGRLAVRLTFPLARLTDHEPPQPSTSPGQSGRSSRPTMTELGLLNLLWEQGQLHQWHPRMAGRRSWAVVANQLAAAAEDILRAGDGLRWRLVVIPNMHGPNLHDAVAKQLAKTVALARAIPHRVESLLIVGELKGVRRGPDAAAVVLARAGQYGLQLFCPLALARRWSERFPAAMGLIETPAHGARVIALLVAELRQKAGQFVGNVTTGALMPTTAEFLPFASRYEREVAARLVLEERWFEKPLRYDAAQPLFPDFVLLDTAQPRFPMEVYGRDDPDYLERRAEKARLYETLYGATGHWEWVAGGVDAMPPFPLRCLRRS